MYTVNIICLQYILCWFIYTCNDSCEVFFNMFTNVYPGTQKCYKLYCKRNLPIKLCIVQITTEAEGKSWSISTSSAKDYVAFKPRSTLPKSSSYSKPHSNGYSNFGADDSCQDNYQDAEFYKRFVMFSKQGERVTVKLLYTGKYLPPWFFFLTLGGTDQKCLCKSPKIQKRMTLCI